MGRTAKKSEIIILQSNNVDKYEKKLNLELKSYIKDEDSKISVKDVTEDDLNNAYRDGTLIQEQCYNFSGIVPLQKVGEVTFGNTYRIPVLYLKGDSNALLSDTENNNWKVEESSVKVEYAFDILGKLMDENTTQDVIEVGFWINGNLTHFTTTVENGHCEGQMWAFEGDSFYPRIRNCETKDLVIVNGCITMTRDDSVKKS